MTNARQSTFQRRALALIALALAGLIVLAWAQSLRIALGLLNLFPPEVDNNGEGQSWPEDGPRRRLIDWIHSQPEEEWIPAVILSQKPADSREAKDIEIRLP